MRRTWSLVIRNDAFGQSIVNFPHPRIGAEIRIPCRGAELPNGIRHWHSMDTAQWLFDRTTSNGRPQNSELKRKLALDRGRPTLASWRAVAAVHRLCRSGYQSRSKILQTTNGATIQAHSELSRPGWAANSLAFSLPRTNLACTGDCDLGDLSLNWTVLKVEHRRRFTMQISPA